MCFVLPVGQVAEVAKVEYVRIVDGAAPRVRRILPTTEVRVDRVSATRAIEARGRVAEEGLAAAR
jgi:hypothetical protein